MFVVIVDSDAKYSAEAIYGRYMPKRVRVLRMRRIQTSEQDIAFMPVQATLPGRWNTWGRWRTKKGSRVPSAKPLVGKANE